MAKSHTLLKRLHTANSLVSFRIAKMKTSACVSLLALLLGAISIIDATGDCDAFWKGVTPLFPGEEETRGGRKKVGVRKGPKKVTAAEEPGTKKTTIPILSQALKWSKPHEMVLFVDDSGSSAGHGTCPCPKQGKEETAPTKESVAPPTVT